jgi:hypothetical protein
MGGRRSLSWIRIELCAAPQNPLSSSFWKTSRSSASPSRAGSPRTALWLERSPPGRYARRVPKTSGIPDDFYGGANLADFCGTLTVLVKGEAPQDVDKSKLENGVYEPLREANLMQ